MVEVGFGHHAGGLFVDFLARTMEVIRVEARSVAGCRSQTWFEQRNVYAAYLEAISTKYSADACGTMEDVGPLRDLSR